MARKWSNLNLPGPLHYVTGNCINRLPVFTEPDCCRAFLNEFETINKSWPAKLITYVVDHDWWWPDDSEKLHEAMKKMGWHPYWKRDEDE